MKTKTSPQSRRSFLRRTAVAGGALSIVPGSVLGLNGATPPSNKIIMGCIGNGGQGMRQMAGGIWSTAGGFIGFPETRIVAVCDVNRQRLEAARDTVNTHYDNKDCAIYKNFEEMLARPDIDAVLVATGERWHPWISMAAARAGKNIYSEKPVSVTVDEARQLADTVKQHGVVFQIGSQQRSMFFFRHAVELVRNGCIGEVKRIVADISPGFPNYCNLPEEPTPEWLDWDRWLGPAPWRPYNQRAAFGWMAWREYSGGDATNWGAHVFDIVQWGLGADASGPVEVIPPGFPGAVKAGDEKLLRFRYANGTLVVCQRVNDMGGASRANIFEGTKGTVRVNREMILTSPESLAEHRFRSGDQRVHFSDNHHADFLRSVRTRQPNAAPAEVACRSLTVAHIGNIALHLGRPLKWDAKTERFVGDEQANRMLSRPVRAQWTV